MQIKRLLALSFLLVATSCSDRSAPATIVTTSLPAYLLTQPAAPRQVDERNTAALNCVSSAGGLSEGYRIQLDFDRRSAAVYFSSNTGGNSTLFHLTWDETRYRLENWNGNNILVVVINRLTGEAVLGTLDAAWRPGAAIIGFCAPGWARL